MLPTPRLTEAERRELLTLVAERPHLTSGQLGKIFAARTGRRVSRCTVDRARTEGFRSIDSTHPRRHLTEAERRALEVECHRAAPTYPRAEIARRFEAKTGRPIHRTCVGKYLAKHFGDSGKAVAR